MRRGGFHGFSFRDLAADVGIKSASVHYHFPIKPIRRQLDEELSGANVGCLWYRG